MRRYDALLAKEVREVKALAQAMAKELEACDAMRQSVHTLYNREYDSHYHADTGVWVDKKCEDATCEFCKDRPDTAPI